MSNNQEPKVQPQPTSAFRDTANKSVVAITYEGGLAVEDGLDDDDYRAVPVRQATPEEPQA